MRDLRPVADMNGDDLQELKEAVCDAVLERTRRVVSGDGDYGRVVLGDKPSRQLASGFILPRLNADGDDESSDIRIPAHGLDLRVKISETGPLRIRTAFAVYVRAMPSAEELFARNGRMIPPADFSADAKEYLRKEIKARLQGQSKPSTPEGRRNAREAIARAVMTEMGVAVPAAARVAGVDTDDADPQPDAPPSSRGGAGNRLRIPSAVSRAYEVPQKWIRIEVRPPELELALPFDPERWRTATAQHTQTLLQALKAACERWISSEDGRLWAWRPGNVPSEAFWSASAWNAYIDGARARPTDSVRLTPEIDLQLLVDSRIDALEPSIASVRVALENLQAHDDDGENGLFGVLLEVRIPEPALVSTRLERVRRSYHLSGFLTMPAMGVNGGVEDAGTESNVRSLRTTWMPRYVLPRMRAADIRGLDATYAFLAETSRDVGDLRALVKEMTSWIATVEDTTRLTWPDEGRNVEDELSQRAHFQADLDAWRREAARVEKGINLLERAQAAWRADPMSMLAVPYRAWTLLNRTFANAYPRRDDQPEPAWRLFQLGFMLAHVPTLASRLEQYNGDFDGTFDEDAASLLYMSTGGGKTEAFFGTLVYGLLLDRLRGKRRGVTAMMHYPLRLLTIQQAQRLARLLAKAEIVRRREGLVGAPFEIGFWVGGANTPNRTEAQGGRVLAELECIPTWADCPIADEERLVDLVHGSKSYIAARDAWNKLPSCPFCDAPTGLRLFPELHNRLGIACTAGNACEWNRENPGKRPEPLPFLLVDSDIYRRAPSVLLGTVDKLALLGQSPHTINKIAGMFGMARFVEGGDDGLFDCSTGDVDELGDDYEAVAPSWTPGRELFHDPFPSLIIQDEMHLLDESLGTFGGVFETGLFAWLNALAGVLGHRACRVPGAPDRPRLPHVIGATATAADSAKHVGALYQKRVVQFPHPGPSLLGGFYVRLGEFSPGSAAHADRTAPASAQTVHPRNREAAAPWARVYASLLTNGRLHTVTTLAVLATHAATVTRWLRDLGSGELPRQEQAANEILLNVSDAQWSERRRAAVAQQIAAGRYDRLAALVDLHRIQLTYVTNKKGGDQILSAINAEVDEAHFAMGTPYALSEFKMELISGGVDVKGIQAVIRSAEHAFDPMRDNVSDTLRGIVATSAISHGVDVETFNAMAFAGMPSDIAEYIQASSRVGRAHVGFSLLIPTPQARRDRFVVSVHETFHRLLERMIAPPAIVRWADRALERTIPSLIQMWLAGVYYQEEFAKAPTTNKAAARFPATVDAVDSIFKGAGGPGRFDRCLDFVRTAVGIDATRGGPGSSAEYYRDLVRQGLIAVRSEIGSGNFTGSLGDFWNNDQNPLRRLRPMTSLRDVDEAGTICASPLTLKNKRANFEELAATMAFLRNRGVARGRLSAESETDAED